MAPRLLRLAALQQHEPEIVVSQPGHCRRARHFAEGAFGALELATAKGRNADVEVDRGAFHALRQRLFVKGEGGGEILPLERCAARVETGQCLFRCRMRTRAASHCRNESEKPSWRISKQRLRRSGWHVGLCWRTRA